jgi:predicted DCC family thiol-disulfide oxidoreductase YuxK
MVGKDVHLNSQLKDYLQIDSVLLYKDSNVDIKSNAILKIIEVVGFPYNLFLVLKILPKSFLDYCYDLIATNRNKLFSQTQKCDL